MQTIQFLMRPRNEGHHRAEVPGRLPLHARSNEQSPYALGKFIRFVQTPPEQLRDRPGHRAIRFIELAELLGQNVGSIRDILRFDRQIVAIAKVYGANTLYTEDENVTVFANECGIAVKHFKDVD